MSKHLSRTVKTFFLASIAFTAISGTAATLRVNQTDHPLDAYAVGALKVALRNIPGDYNLAITTQDITQTRAIENLRNGDMDVMWLASNSEVESQLIPILFPMLKGLLGHRVFIINPDEQQKFSSVSSFEDFGSLTFGQGQGWPDVEILKSNGLNVVTTSKYDNLFYMVEGGRFDAFPRGVLEPWVEISAHPELELAVEKHLVLIYKLPFYFFVSPENQALAKTLKQGLDNALKNGDFDEYFYNTELVKDALSRSQLKNRLAFTLQNPFLGKNTPLNVKEYWLNLDEL